MPHKSVIEPVPHLLNLGASLQLAAICAVWNRATKQRRSELGKAIRSGPTSPVFHRAVREMADLKKELLAWLKPWTLRIPPFGFGGVTVRR
jgi:hypothetical protein